MKLWFVLALVACKGEPARPIANTGGTHVPMLPAGWVTIAPPDEERRHCANYADDDWQVAVDGDRLAFTDPKDHEADTGPALPFTPKQTTEIRGRQHVVAVSDGFLVGLDAGEWGGSLWWFSRDGQQSAKLADDNVRGLVALGPDLVVAIEGLSHLSISEGNVQWIERAGQWRAGKLTPLDAGPSTYAAVDRELYVLTTQSLVRVGADRKATVIQPVDTSRLYPDSMAIDAAGELWIGMRQFIVRMAPRGARYDATWFVRETCVRATVRGLACDCAPR